MAKLLNVVYSALVILVAVAGLAVVFWTPGASTGDDGPRWPGLVVAFLLLLFLLVMVGDLVLVGT